MKTFKTIMAVAICAVAAMSVEPAFAQDYTKKEKREMKREMNEQQEEFYDKAPKKVRKQAKRLEKEGWRAMNIPIENQLQNLYDRVSLFAPDGFPKYIDVVSEATGTNFNAAQMHAENIAKVRIASNTCSTIQSLVDAALANHQLSPEMSASISKVVENSKVIVSQKLGMVYFPVTVYKQTRNTCTVRVNALYNREQAMNIAQQTVLQELGKESEENKRQLESLLGMDKIQDQYNKMDFDEEL